MAVVSNTSPLIFLSKLGRLDLLSKLFDGKIIIPNEVHKELTQKDKTHALLFNMNAHLFEIKSANRKLPGTEFLGPGERHAIIIAKELNTKTILMDDKPGRILARALGLDIVGTAGILLYAMDLQLVTFEEFETMLNQLVQQHGYWLSASAYSKIIEEARKIEVSKQNS